MKKHILTTFLSLSFLSPLASAQALSPHLCAHVFAGDWTAGIDQAFEEAKVQWSFLAERNNRELAKLSALMQVSVPELRQIYWEVQGDFRYTAEIEIVELVKIKVVGGVDMGEIVHAYSEIFSAWMMRTDAERMDFLKVVILSGKSVQQVLDVYNNLMVPGMSEANHMALLKKSVPAKFMYGFDANKWVLGL